MDSKNNKNNKNSKNNRNLRGVLVLLAWAVVLTIGFNYFAAYAGNAANKATSFEVDFSALADLVREDKIARVEFENGQILATPIDGYVYTDESGKEPKTYTNSEKTKVILYTTQINSNNFYDLLDEHHVAYTAPVVEQMSPILQFMISYILPTILILGAFLLVMRLLSKSIGGIGSVAALGFAYVKLVEAGVISYGADRIRMWEDPWIDALDEGYQMCQSLIAIGSGGLTGVGLGKGRQKFLYLPEEHNDFIFSVTCEELGFIGAVLIIVLFVLFIVQGLLIAYKAENLYCTMVGIGIMAQIAWQVFCNIAVVTNTLPNTGISLPFFSSGGTSLMMLLGEMGIVLSVSRGEM